MYHFAFPEFTPLSASVRAAGRSIATRRCLSSAVAGGAHYSADTVSYYDKPTPPPLDGVPTRSAARWVNRRTDRQPDPTEWRTARPDGLADGLADSLTQRTERRTG